MNEKLALLFRRANNFPAGFGACFVIAVWLMTEFVMQPKLLLRWVFAPGTSDEKVARSLDPQGHADDVRAKLVEAQSSVIQCQNEIRRNVAETKPSSPSCVIGLDGLYGEKVFPDEARSFFSGRIHLSVDRGFMNGCAFFARTDKTTELKQYRFGAAVEVETDIGKYNIIPVSYVDSWFSSRGCVFNILKSSEPSVITGSTSSSAAGKRK